MAETTKQLQANLDAITAKVDRLNKEMGKLSAGSDDYKIKQRSLNEELKKGTKAADKHALALNKLNGNNSKHSNSLRGGTKAQQGWTAASDKATNSSKKFGGAMGGRIATLGKYLLATKLIQLALVALRVIFIDTAKEAIKFDGALGDLQSVTGSTNEELAGLREVALDTAGATKLTAVEVVGLQKELAKLGTSAADIEKLTKPIAQLSQALGESGAEVAKVFKSILNQFDLTTNRSVDIANIIQKSVASSALDLNGLATGFGYVGTQAALTGLTVEETAANLAVLSDNGLKASKAGTGFRNVLIAATKSGKTYTQFIDDLAKKGLSGAEALQLFGKRAAAAGIILVRERQAVKGLSEELNDNTAVFDAQIAQMGNAAGQVELLKSAYNRLQISIGQTVVKSDLFIAAIKLLDRQTGDEASFFRTLSTASNETRDNVDALINRLGKLNEAGDEVQLNGNNNEIINQVLFETLTQGDKFEKAKAKYLKDIADGVYTVEQKNFETFLKSKFGFSGLAEEATTQLDVLAGQGRERMQGIADDVQRATKPIADAIKTVNAFEVAALQGNYVEEEGIKYEALLQLQITARKAQLEELKKVQDQQQALFDEDEDNEGRLRRVTVNDEYVEEAKAGIDILESLAKTLINTENAITDADGSGGSRKPRFDIEPYKLRRANELQALADQKAYDLESAKSSERRNEIEVSYAEDVAQANNDAAAELALIDSALYSNELSINGVLAKWEKLSSVTGEESVKIFQSFVKGLNTDIGKDIDELKEQLGNSEITVDEYNETVAESIEANTAVVRRSLDQLIEAGDLTEAQGAALKKALENVEIDPETKFSPDQTLLGRLLGIDAAEFIGDSLKGVQKEQAEAIEDQFKEDLSKILGELGEIYGEFSDERLDNIVNEQKAELDVIKERYSIEEEILKSSLNNQLITEGQYRIKQKELKKAQLNEENAVNQKIFDAKKKQDKQSAVADGLEAAAIAIVNAWKVGEPITAQVRAGLSAAAIAAGTGARVVAINQRQFYPKKFEQGGMVSGPSHAEGGVPFTVQGRGGYEMEGGEFIVNKRSASMHKDLLDKINSSGRTAAVIGTQKFAQGGEVIGSQGSEGVEYLKVIADGVMKTAGNTGKPTRAFVSSKDLATNSRERSITNNNDRV